MERKREVEIKRERGVGVGVRRCDVLCYGDVLVQCNKINKKRCESVRHSTGDTAHGLTSTEMRGTALAVSQIPIPLDKTPF